MAQHISIMETNILPLSKARQAIVKAFGNSNGMRTSMRYLYNPGLSQDYNKPDIDVYLTTRRIGKGIVHGTDKGTFEIHFNRLKKTIENIYLVA